jgi:hypothetical protein
MRRSISAIHLLMFLPVLAGEVRAEKGVIQPLECKSQLRIVENLEGVLESGEKAGTGGDPEKSYKIYQRAAQSILEGYPDCEDIHNRLEDALERSGTMGRSTDRAEELKRCFDGIL